VSRAPETEPLPQSWVPRVLNAALAVFLLACVAPVVTTFGDRGLTVQVFLVVAVVPTVLVALLCACSALRPGSLGRAARRARARRRRD
jgi:threonine/homoserine/homoserine lactone efflux protein